MSVQRLETFSIQLEEFARLLPAVDGYLQRQSEMTWYERGALNEVLVAHDRVRQSLHDSYGQLQALLSANSRAIAAAARYYETTDLEAAASFDRMYGIPRSLAGPAVYFDGLRTDPLSRLHEPPQTPDDAMHGSFDLAMISSYFSISNDLNTLIDQLTGVDILSHLSQLVLGDWDAFGRLAVALHNGALFEMDVSFGLADDLDPLRDGWHGAAADNAMAYFAKLDGTLQEHRDLLERLATAYLGASFSINIATQQLNSMIGSLIDLAIIAAISAAAGTATAETGIGAVAGWGIAIWKIIEFLNLWSKAAAVIQAAVYTLTGLVPVVLEIAQLLGVNTSITLPAVYQHPALAEEGHK